jgi:hypothetical protein
MAMKNQLIKKLIALSSKLSGKAFAYSLQLRAYTSMALCAILAIVIFSGCGITPQLIKKGEASLAASMGRTPAEMTLDCWAGIARADMEISPDPVSVRKVEAVMKYADEDSDDFRECFSATAKLYYLGAKLEGAVRTWIKKLTEYGVIIP